jgi:thioredoxin reductase (NADPH)
LRNRKTGEEKTVKTRWLFVCIGGAPHTEWAVEAGVVRDQAGYLVTGPDLVNGSHTPPNGLLDRSVRHNSVKRCASAVGEGAVGCPTEPASTGAVHRNRSAGDVRGAIIR